jgi:hypothetical protein
MADLCIDRRRPVPKISSIASNNTVTILFNKEVSQ